MLTSLLAELVLIVVAGSFAVWGLAGVRLYRDGSMVPLAPRRVVPWGAGHLIVIVAGVLLLQSVAWLGVSAGPEARMSDLSPADRLRVTGAVGLASLLATLIGGWLLVGTAGADRRDLGLPDGPAGLVRDLKLGLFGFLAASLPVYAIQWLIVFVQHGFGEKPVDHPLITMLKESSGGGALAVAVIVAVFVAPVFEEFVFRLVLQGWLEKLAAAWRSTVMAHNAAESDELDGVETEVEGPLADVPSPWPASPVDPADSLAPGTAVDQSPWLAHWPIVASSALFAAMHLGHGFDPIPLFFLALGLGYLYYRTHRIVPCIVMHALFNAFSLAMLGLDSGGASG